MNNNTDRPGIAGSTDGAPLMPRPNPPLAGVPVPTDWTFALREVDRIQRESETAMETLRGRVESSLGPRGGGGAPFGLPDLRTLSIPEVPGVAAFVESQIRQRRAPAIERRIESLMPSGRVEFDQLKAALREQLTALAHREVEWENHERALLAGYSNPTPPAFGPDDLDGDADRLNGLLDDFANRDIKGLFPSSSVGDDAGVSQGGAPHAGAGGLTPQEPPKGSSQATVLKRLREAHKGEFVPECGLGPRNPRAAIAELRRLGWEVESARAVRVREGNVPNDAAGYRLRTQS